MKASLPKECEKSKGGPTKDRKKKPNEVSMRETRSRTAIPSTSSAVCYTEDEDSDAASDASQKMPKRELQMLGPAFNLADLLEGGFYFASSWLLW